MHLNPIYLLWSVLGLASSRWTRAGKKAEYRRGVGAGARLGYTRAGSCVRARAAARALHASQFISPIARTQ